MQKRRNKADAKGGKKQMCKKEFEQTCLLNFAPVVFQEKYNLIKFISLPLLTVALRKADVQNNNFGKVIHILFVLFEQCPAPLRLRPTSPRSASHFFAGLFKICKSLSRRRTQDQAWIFHKQILQLKLILCVASLPHNTPKYEESDLPIRI
jgi:hypothetical protein